MPAPIIPEIFGDFLLVQRLGRSAMAEVLLAIRLGDRSGRTYVVKRPLLGERPSGLAAQAIAREAEVLESTRAPGLPALEAAGELAGLPYLALEHIRGAPLDELLARGPLPPPAVTAIALDLGRALAALHAAGWVHGDVTPSNVLIDDAGEARLLDLGLARRAGERRPEVAGKPGYVAPEAALPSPASPAEDVYSLGVVLAECLLGRRLFPERDLVEAATRAEAQRELATIEEALPGVAATLARRPEQRPTVAALVEQLEALPTDRAALADQVTRQPSSAPEAPPPEPVEKVLTPTAPMVVGQRPGNTLEMAGSAAAPVAASATVAASAIAAAPAAGPAAAADGPPRRAWVGLLLVCALLFFVMGAFVGRVSTRWRPGSISVAGPLPRRAQLELDGRPFAIPIGAPATVKAGQHTLSIVQPRGNRQDYTFQVRPNEHIVIMSPTRRPGVDTEEAP